MIRPALILAVALCFTPAAASAADIKVMSGGAPKGALTLLIPRFETLTGHHVEMTYQVISALKQRLSQGEAPDMVLLPTSAMAELSTKDVLQQQGSAPFGTIRLVAIVREGAPLPDVSTPDRLRDTLLNARSIVFSTPTATPSGAHMARVVTELGIADAIRSKVIYRPALEGGAEMVATGEAEIGIYPSSEVVEVKGVVPAGLLPDALQLALTYAGAVSAANHDPAPSLALIRFLAEPDNKHVWKDAGFDPS